uniref:Glycosyltransferase n=1 Tax=viral metagenome TaxID=1070528 RepID=A0A6M3KIF6_9ZZZZ
MLITKKFNHGLGILPVSLFVELCSPNLDINKLYKEITDTRCNDIIFFNNISENADCLRWILPRLISDGCFVSLVMKHDILYDLPCNRVICFLNCSSFQSEFKKTKLQLFTENDIVVVYGDFVIDRINKCLNLLKKIELKSKVLFYYKDRNELTALLDNGIDFVFPYEGKLFIT